MKAKTVNKRLRIIFFFLSIALLIIITIGYYVFRSIFYLEEHCRQVALEEVGGEKGWISQLVDAPPWFQSEVPIYIGFYKQLECEHNDKAFYFF